MSRHFLKVLLALVLPVSLACIALATPASAVQSVRLQYKNSSTGATTAQAEPWFKLVNTGTESIPLNQVKIRYYFRGETTYRFACSWAVVGCSTVTGRFVDLATPVPTADRYLEVGFTSGTSRPVRTPETCSCASTVPTGRTSPRVTTTPSAPRPLTPTGTRWRCS